MPQVEYFSDVDPFFSILDRDDVDVKRINSIGEEMARVEYSMDDDHVKDLDNVNVVIAAYTTAYGRLELYKHLERLQHRVLYFDTGKSSVPKEKNTTILHLVLNNDSIPPPLM